MKRSRLILSLLGVVLCLPAIAGSEEPEKVTVCQLQSDSPTYSHKLIEVEGFASSDFEDFTLFDPSCRDLTETWLRYGGKTDSGTMYCCGTTPNSHHPDDLTVEGISIPLVENDAFRQFARETRAPSHAGNHGSVVHVTIVGRFFAGEQRSIGGRRFPGYGHMGCCTLLAIQMVKSVDPQDRNDLDYSASPPTLNGLFLTPIYPGKGVIEDQKQADLGPRAWAFSDPRRVAYEAVLGFAKLEGAPPLKLKTKEQYPASITYEWRLSRRSSLYTVIVSRPYFLSFYANDPKKVAWVVTAAFRAAGGD